MKNNRVWIELEVPVVNPKGPTTNSQKENPNNVVKTKDEQRALMQVRALLASQMIRRLCPGQIEDRITVYEDKHGVLFYSHQLGGGTFSVMSDHGVWMNLDYLGREDK